MPSFSVSFASISLRTTLAQGVALCVLLALWAPNLLGVPALADQVEIAVLGAVLWLLCVALLGRLWLVLVLALPAALVWPLELWLRWHNGTPISPHLAALVLESNWAESANFLSAYGFGLVWFGLAGAVCSELLVGVAVRCALAAPLPGLCSGSLCDLAGAVVPISWH